ncbi:MAG TPA: hypothetical protein VK530_20940, partial [Candidatus Acidoferrum sp.]|nr:hypothetical protein [Candidatus Acidoferrum sp.]
MTIVFIRKVAGKRNISPAATGKCALGQKRHSTAESVLSRRPSFAMLTNYAAFAIMPVFAESHENHAH